MNPAGQPRAPERMLLRFALYFRPHVFGVLGSVAVVWMIRTLSVMGGSCRVLCYPPITIAMGVVGGLLGARTRDSKRETELGREYLVVKSGICSAGS